MKRLAILCSYSGEGGVERVVNLLAAELIKHVQVDLLTLKFRGPHTASVPEGVKLIRLRSTHSATAEGEIADYLRRVRPDAMLAAKDRGGRAALRAGIRAGTHTPVWLQLHTTLSASLARRSRLTRWLRLRAIRRDYPLATGIACVSRGVADDLVAISGLDPALVHAVYNPVVTERVAEMASAPNPHPWLEPGQPPVFIGVGRLTAQKDFPTLVQAFAQARAQRPCRLVILGEGAELETLQQLAQQLGVSEDVLLPGFQNNPYAWIARATQFVLSSAWEGSPTVLTEALSLGVPCVATDCPSGPFETLAAGRYGPLVPVGDARALGEAMLRTLDDSLPPDTLREAVREYTPAVSAMNYLRLLGLAEA